MNYQAIYNQIINRAKQEKREKGGGFYYENHHIIPKCMGGSNKRANLVLLTGREHFLVHWILARIYPNNIKLVSAFWAMCNQKNSKQGARYTPSSKAYEEAKRVFLGTSQVNQKHFWQTEEGKVARDKQVQSLKAFHQTNKGKEMRAKRNSNHKAYYQTQEGIVTREGISNKVRKPILQYRKDGTLVREWSCSREASKALHIDAGNIASCLKGRRRSTGTFIWKYKEKGL